MSRPAAATRWIPSRYPLRKPQDYVVSYPNSPHVMINSAPGFSDELQIMQDIIISSSGLCSSTTASHWPRRLLGDPLSSSNQLHLAPLYHLKLTIKKTEKNNDWTSNLCLPSRQMPTYRCQLPAAPPSSAPTLSLEVGLRECRGVPRWRREGSLDSRDMILIHGYGGWMDWLGTHGREWGRLRAPPESQGWFI